MGVYEFQSEPGCVSWTEGHVRDASSAFWDRVGDSVMYCKKVPCQKGNQKED